MIFTVILIIAFILFYLYNTRDFNYWKDRGVKHDDPILLFGTNAKNYLIQQSYTQMLVETYWKYPKEKVVGMFRSSRPTLVIRDPNIVKRILTTDFAYFHKRGLNQHDDVVEPLFRNIFFAEGDTWRLLRQRMTPAFTSGKLRAMFPLIVDRAERLQAYTATAATTGRTVDARDLMARYTTDFIGACAFGLDTDSLSDEDSTFRKLGANILNFRLRDILVLYMKDIFPEVFKNFKIMDKVEDEMISLVKAILKQRNYQPSGRNDFIDLLLECKNNGLMVGESMTKVKKDGTPEMTSLELDDVTMAAQIFIFFIAGFETSSTATSFTLHQLAYNPEVQKKVQDEIDRVLSKHENKLSYDAIKEMTYLEWTLKEGMRMFPSLGYLLRKCARKYTFPDLDITIDAGVRVYIPVQAMQMDPQYFENPEEFRPERFNPEKFDGILKYVFLPFGTGPRACIGERLGLMQSLAGLAAVLSRFSVRPAPESVRQPQVKPASGVVQIIRGGVPLLFEERQIAA
ncbi:unnamed protein product [Diatraea saccharalis]|uniref:unspecific monooxygenase n=1 Tax=Diatraea saccharalis TaxID=40085 RepID=A0A9N9R7Z9_9NEOP|nr:unnamed protein product [Diatraea saccharalis]